MNLPTMGDGVMARGLEKSVIRALTRQSACVQNHENIFVLGPTGGGKSFMACALAQKACRDGCSALYTRAAALFRDLAIARADGSLRNLLSRLSRIDDGVHSRWPRHWLGNSRCLESDVPGTTRKGWTIPAARSKFLQTTLQTPSAFSCLRKS